ncbi:MAG: T9SS type A sorting domain-containing protein [Bacteroidota bacterium]
MTKYPFFVISPPLFLLFFILLSNSCFAQIGTNEKIIFFQTNLVVDPADSLLARIDRAKAKGANKVIFRDSKLDRYGLNGTAGTQWDAQMNAFVNGVKARNMDLILGTINMGFNGSILSSNPDLSTGYPIKQQAMIVRNGILEPIKSSGFSNGGFEDYNKNRPGSWWFQDSPGSITFIDTTVKRSGNASLRIDAQNAPLGRIFTRFPVKSFHQYVLVFWMKTERLSVDRILPLIRDENNRDRNLTNLSMSIAKSNGGRAYFREANNLDLDWTEIRIAFNSLNATEVNLGLGVFGGQSGKLWFDDVEIIDAPFLNWLNRTDLPKSLIHNTQELDLGIEIEDPVDPLLGQSVFTGNYDCQHLPPAIRNLPNSPVQDEDSIFVNGYHAIITGPGGQVSGSWNHPEMFSKMRQIHEKLFNDFQPDGFHLNYTEIRAGGWEPLDLQFATAGAALAHSIGAAIDSIKVVAPGTEIYFWSDMVDPFHNARVNYYQVNNTLDQAWTSLDPDDVIIIPWWEGEKISNLGPSSLAFFDSLNFKQIIGGFYDADIQDNFNRWNTAARGITNITGSMYTTWTKDYSKIGNFGDNWWTINTSINDPEVLDLLSIYPNPVREKLFIDSAEKLAAIQVLNPLGHVVPINFTYENSIWQASIQHLPSGFYFLRLEGDFGLVSKKILVDK